MTEEQVHGAGGAPSAPNSELTLSQIELIERIGWLISLRWVAFVGVVSTILIVREVFVCDLPWTKLLIAASTIPVYNAICLVLWRRVQRLHPERVGRSSTVLANVQISLDLVVLGALIHLSGGLENLFGFYFVFHMVIASILLSRRAAFGQATLAVGIFWLIAIGEYRGWLPHYVSPVGIGNPNLYKDPIQVFAACWVMTTSLYISVYFATSITARLREREQEVMTLSKQLQQTAENLRTAYEKLAETEKMKSRYLRKVAHELRSPLAAIESLLRVVAEGLHGEVPEGVLNTISRARARTHELLALVRDLLALAALKEAPADSAPRCTCDFKTILEHVISVIKPQAESRGIHIETHVSWDTPCVLGNPEQFEELLTNLLSNAVKYSYDGGKVEVRLARSGDFLRLEVADQGIGIDEAEQSRIFEEFYRSKDAREFTPEGTGLGLSIVKTIVDSHGGAILLESKKGAGTKFTVLLPAAETAEES
ncbi:MAG: HAMP domain-containing sensor histidine kinase [Armatimonadota bacterium]|nr:HAMP domain-containing sensor histidine kinase [Armatimonadota bacterium]